MINCHRKSLRWQLKLHLSLCSLIRLNVKCHLSPCDWDRKPSRASCHKHQFGILQIFFGWGFSLSISLFLSLSLSSCISSSTHTYAHGHAHAHTYTQRMLPSLKDYTLLTPLLITAWTAGCSAFSGKLGYFSLIFFFFHLSPFPLRVKARRKHILLSESTLLCIRLETLARLSHMSSLEP